jgi:hypothetical protein
MTHVPYSANFAIRAEEQRSCLYDRGSDAAARIYTVRGIGAATATGAWGAGTLGPGAHVPAISRRRQTHITSAAITKVMASVALMAADRRRRCSTTAMVVAHDVSHELAYRLRRLYAFRYGRRTYAGQRHGECYASARAQPAIAMTSRDTPVVLTKSGVHPAEGTRSGASSTAPTRASTNRDMDEGQ